MLSFLQDSAATAPKPPVNAKVFHSNPRRADQKSSAAAWVVERTDVAAVGVDVEPFL